VVPSGSRFTRFPRDFAVFFSLRCIALCSLALSGVLSEPTPRRYEYAQSHMGTEFRVVFYAHDPEVANKASVAAFERIARLDATMSDYARTSELNGVCRRAGEGPVPVSEDLFGVLDRARELAAKTGGAFDVTCGPVVRLWRKARRTGELPEKARLAEALALVGPDKLRLDRKSRSVALAKAGMQLDLGGIAKGYAADEALAVLGRFGIRRALVAAGGDVAVGDAPPGERGWRVAVAPLGSDGGTPPQFMLRDAAVSTSGDAEQFVEIGGVRYSHIVDPRTGIGVTGRSGVTVVAPDATTSDSLATAISVLGSDEGLRLADATEGVAARFVSRQSSGDTVFESKRWSAVSIVDR
jgi:FAD:protein FMN transferase